jgi:DNA-binding transcriptional ArsR family regulator
LTTARDFDISGVMEISKAVAALGALAQETRLRIFRALVQRGPDGVPAGRIATLLDLPGPTLSFHLAHLKRVGLVSCRRDGRSLIYAADYGAMEGLVAYLTENCCGRDQVCAPGARTSARAASRSRAVRG